MQEMKNNYYYHVNTLGQRHIGDCGLLQSLPTKYEKAVNELTCDLSMAIHCVIGPTKTAKTSVMYQHCRTVTYFLTM